MLTPEVTADLQHVPRFTSRVLARPSLLVRLDGPAPLIVLRAPGGTGKTTLMAQWAVATAPARHGSLLWIEADDGTRTRTGFWMRVLGRFHARGLIEDRALYREMASIADHADTIPATIRRVLEEHGQPVTLLLDDVGSAAEGSYWDEACQDLVEILRRVPFARAVVAGRFRTVLEAASTRAVLDTQVITEEQLALSSEEIATLVDLTVPGLQGDPRRAAVLDQLGAQPASRRLASMRWSLGVLQHALETGSTEQDLALDELLVMAFRHELASRPGDPVLRAFLEVTAQSPLVDIDLARQLSGRHDAETLLGALEQLGAGQWLRGPAGSAPVFQYSHHLRLAAAANFSPPGPARLRELHSLIARWLADVRDETFAAIEHALRADDIAHVEQLLMRSHPLAAEDAQHVSRLLREIPPARLHRHPMLALWHALVLNRSADTQQQAVQFFLSAALIGRVRSASTPPLDRAIRQGIQSAVHRMLGQARQTRDLALRALPVLESTAEDPERDRRLDGILMTAISQSATSLFYAGELTAARDARLLQARFAGALHRAHQHNVAHAHLALIDAVRGDLVAATASLAQIDAEHWPHTWRSGYHDAPEIIARAWVALNEARPEEALTQLSHLDPHFSTIEYWDLITTARSLALAHQGLPDEAEAFLDRTIVERRTERTLPSAVQRLETAAAMLRILTDGVPARRSGAQRDAPMVAALSTRTVIAEGRPEEALPLLARAELAATTPLHRMITAIAGVHVARRSSLGLDMAGYGLQIRELTGSLALRWPLVLLSPGDREALLQALTGSGREQTAALLEADLSRIPPGTHMAEPSRVPQLTAREREVLTLLAQTDRRSEIASRLFVSPNTVKSQLRSLYAKLGASTREQALAKAISAGLLRPTDSPDDGDR